MELRLRLGSTSPCCDRQQGCACMAVSEVPEMKAATPGCRQAAEAGCRQQDGGGGALGGKH